MAMEKFSFYRVFERARGLFGGSLLITLNFFLLSLLGFGFWGLAARILEPTQVGLATARISSLELIGSLSLLGLNVVLLRKIRNHRRREGLTASAIFFGALAAALLGLAFGLGFNNTLRLEAGLGLAGFTLIAGLVSVGLLLDAALLGLGMAGRVLYRGLAVGLSKLLLLVIMLPYGAFGLVAAYGLSVLLGVAVGWAMLPFRIKWGLNLGLLLREARLGFLNYLAGVSAMLPGLALPLIIAQTMGAESAAYFLSAFMLAGLLFIVPNAVFSVLVSEGSKDSKGNKQLSLLALMLVWGLLLPGVLLILGLGKWLLGIFGVKYAENGLQLLRMLSLSSLPLGLIAVSNAYNNLKLMPGRVAITNLTLAFLTLILCLNLLRFGLFGVGLGWLLASILVAIPLAVQFFRRI